MTDAEHKITVRRAGPVVVIAPHGEIRRERTEQLTHAIDLAIRENVDHIIVTFRYVSVLLSDGIRLLVALRDKTAEAGKLFYITDLPKPVQYTLKITNLLEFFQFHEELKPLLKKLDIEHHHDDIVRPEPEAVAEEKPTTPAPRVPTDELKLDNLPPETPELESATAEDEEPEEPALILDEEEPEKEEAPVAPSAPAEPEAAEAEEPEEEAAPAEEPEATEESEEEDEDEDGEEEVRDIISRFLPDRLAIEIVDYYIRKGVSVASIEQIAVALDKDFDEVYDKASELVSRTVLKSLGAELVNYGPETELNEAIRWFLKLWHSRQFHGHILSMVISNEESRKKKKK